MHKNSIKKVPVIKNPVCVMVSFSKTSYTFSQAKQKGESRHDGMNGTLDSSLPMTTATVGLGLLLFLYSRFTVLLFLPRSQPNNAHTHTHTQQQHRRRLVGDCLCHTSWFLNKIPRIRSTCGRIATPSCLVLIQFVLQNRHSKSVMPSMSHSPVCERTDNVRSVLRIMKK